MRDFIDITQKGVALGLLFVLTLNSGRIATDIFRMSEYQKEIMRDLDHLSDNGITVAEVSHPDCH